MADQPSVPRTPVDPGASLTLSVKERFMFGNIFPDEGNLLEMKIIKSIQKKIDFEVKELQEIEYTTVLDENGKPTSRVTWNEQKEKPLIVELTGLEIDFLKKIVNRLSGENKIGRDWMDLAIKIDEAKKGE